MAAKPTHAVVKMGTNNSTDSTLKSQKELRAARFGLDTSTGASSTGQTTTSSGPTILPVDPDKLAKRAAKFADVKSTSSSASSFRAPTAGVDNEKLAARASKFADVLQTSASPSTTTTTGKSSGIVGTPRPDADVMAKRAARFANTSGQ